HCENVGTLAAVEAQQRVAQVVVLQTTRLGVLGVPGIEFLVGLVDVAVEMVIKEVLDIPKTEVIRVRLPVRADGIRGEPGTAGQSKNQHRHEQRKTERPTST